MDHTKTLQVEVEVFLESFVNVCQVEPKLLANQKFHFIWKHGPNYNYHVANATE